MKYFNSTSPILDHSHSAMGLLELPTELRIQILEDLPDFSYGRHETIGPNVRLTPAICRVCRVLRYEALPLYAKTSSFIMQADGDTGVCNDRVQAWLQAMGADALREVQSLQLSRHWKLCQPSRWQGHVGFYVRLQLHDKTWSCNVGTYPIANDDRGMRRESIELLRGVIKHRLRLSCLSGEEGLSRCDVEFIMEAMDIVASHPISTTDTERDEDGRRRRREYKTWLMMKRDLLGLTNAILPMGDDDLIVHSSEQRVDDIGLHYLGSYNNGRFGM